MNQKLTKHRRAYINFQSFTHFFNIQDFESFDHWSNQFQFEELVIIREPQH